MYIKTAKKKTKRMRILIFLFLYFIILANLDNAILTRINKSTSENVDKSIDDYNNILLSNSQPFFYEYSDVGVYQNVSEFGQGSFQNNDINTTNFENASIIVPENWNADTVLCDITNIYEYDKLWIDGVFDSGYDETHWSNNTIINYNSVFFDWYNDSVGSNDSIYIKHLGGVNWIGEETYWNYTFNLDREEIPYKTWNLDFNYRIITNDTVEWIDGAPGGARIFCRLFLGINQVQFEERKISILNNNTWYQDNIAGFSPELYELDPPGTMSVILGVNWGSGLDFTPQGNFSLYFDNISLNLQTIPKPSQISLNITDNTHGNKIYNINDVDGEYGRGLITINDYWAGMEGGSEHNFTFYSNSTANLYIHSDFFVNATSSRFTTTEIGFEGSEFTVKNETLVNWVMYFPVSIPGSYSNYYHFNVTKPTNWNVTHVYDPYGNDKISQVLATSGIGNSTLIIPNELIINGIWKIEAESPNYMLNATIWKWKTSIWEKNTSFEVSDKIKINTTIHDDLIPNIESTSATLLIYYPNGSEWIQAFQISQPNPLGYVEFNNFTLGAFNSSAGRYTVISRWNNLNYSQIGFKVYNFEVIHESLLYRANDQEPIVTPIYTGDSILIKVNYTDLDTGLGIFDAYLNYTIDTPIITTGDLVYFGGGVYVAEIDTSGWTNGIYNISVSANKTFYKSQYQEDLIQLEVTERTTLTTPQIGGINVPWGHNFTIDISYNDSSNQGIPSAIIETDWDKDYYMVQYIALGDYQIIFNATSKTLGTNVLKINASKPGYENQEIYMSVYIRNIYTNLTYISPSPVGYNQNITIQVKYGNIDDKTLISGADVTISSDVGSNYWNSTEYSYNEVALGTYDITFNSSRFPGAGVFQIYIIANKTNYNNATSLVNVFIEEISSYLEIFLNGVNKTLDKSMTTIPNQTLNVTVFYKNFLTDKHITGANVELSVGTIFKTLQEEFVLNHYNTSVNTDDLEQGINFLTILAQRDGYKPQSILLTVEMTETETAIIVFANGTDITDTPSLKINIGEQLNITVLYKKNQTGTFIDSASVRLLGEGLNETLIESLVLEQYTLILNSLDLNQGINFLTIYAQKPNYQTQILLITIEITDRETNLNLFLNQVNKTLDKSMELPIGSSLNITIKYFDYEIGYHISNASVRLIGEGLDLQLNENPALEHYTLVINTEQLDIGIKFLTIYAQRANFQSYSVLSRITVKRIETEIITESGESVINAETGERVTLRVTLNDIDFNETITNATVRYNWPYGQGELLDLDNDGMYETIFENVREGTHTIIIIAYEVSDNYEFKRYEITLVVTTPSKGEGGVLLFQILAILGIAAAIGIGSYLIAYLKVLKYPKQVRKIHKFKKSLKKQRVPDIEISSRENLLKTIFDDVFNQATKFLKTKVSEKIPERQPLIDKLHKIDNDKSSNKSLDDIIKKE